MEPLPSFGPWRAVEKLGEGGVCVVWHVRNEEDGSEGAIKVLADATADNVERFVREAQMLMEIDHPNILGVRSVAADARPPWYLMELLRGVDLDALRAKGPVSPWHAASLIAQVADGLALVHGLGIRHRDIKPANIVIDARGIPKLIDFGIARRVQDTHQTTDGMVVGTAAYLAPEVWEADDPHAVQDTEASDVYALGQTLCELLIGRPIYERSGGNTALGKILRDKLEREALDPRDWNPEVPEALAAVVRDATRREPGERIATAEALRLRLEGWDVPPPRPVPTGPPTAPIRRPSAAGAMAWRAGAGLIAIALLFLGTLGGLIALWQGRPRPPGPADPRAVGAALIAQAGALRPCASGRPATVTATWVVSGGRTWHSRADSTTADAATTTCVLRALDGLTWPRGTLAVTAPIELR